MYRNSITSKNIQYSRKDFLKRFYILIFRKWRKEGERKRKKPQCVVASPVSPTGDLACNPGMCPDWESNQRSFGSQAGTQCTEPHQPGPEMILFNDRFIHSFIHSRTTDWVLWEIFLRETRPSFSMGWSFQSLYLHLILRQRFAWNLGCDYQNHFRD